MNERKLKNLWFGKFCIFILCLSAVACIAPIISVLRIKTYTYKLPESATILFIGDSFFAQGVDDSVIPGAFNCSRSADSFLTGYFRLKFLLQNNPQIKTVFVSVSPYNLSRGADETIFRPSLVSMKVPYYLPFFGKDEWILFLRRSPKPFLQTVFASPSVYLKKSKLSEKKYLNKLGAFNPRDNKTLEKAIEITQTLERPHYWTNRTELHYLKKIRVLCEMKNIRLIFCCTPLHDVDKYLDVNYFQEILTEHFPDVEFWNYMNFPMENTMFEDVSHLNRFGAEKFGKILAERIERNNLA